MPLFRKQQPSDEELIARAERDLAQANTNYAALVPASAREPGSQRLTPLVLPDELDEADEDLRFLSSLVSAVEKEAPAPRRPAPAPALIETAKPAAERADDLAAFRDVLKVEERPPVTRVIAMEDVDVADLLDDLETTMAALRRRRAA